MAANKPAENATPNNNDKPDWGGFKGTIKKGSLVENGDKLEATGVTAEGKEHKVIAYPHSKGAADKLRALHDSGEEKVIRGPMLGSAKKETFHFGFAQALEPSADRPKLSDEEKAANAAARKADNAEARKISDQTRVPVVVGSVEDGATISVGGKDVVVTGLGTAWKLDEAGVAGLAQRFPDVSLKAGDEVQFAKFEPAPELDDSPTP